MPNLLLCCVLVLLTPVDDAWARATAEPDDDARAAANNDFLPRTADEAPRVPPAPAPGVGLTPGTPGPCDPPAPPAPEVSSLPDRLYLLMSLQR
jgi:hypothetical protein